MAIRIAAVVLAATLISTIFSNPAHADENDELREQVEDIIKDMRKDQDFRAYWGGTRRFATADKKFEMKVGGRIMVDAAAFKSDDFEDRDIDRSDYQNALEFRRIRLFSEGTIYSHIGYQLDLAFEKSSVDLKDVYISLVGMQPCLGCLFPDILIGRFKQPNTLEFMTSSKYITFMERGAVVNVFSTKRTTGLLLARRDLRGGSLGYQLSVGTPGTQGGEIRWDEETGTGLAARVFWAPWWDCNCTSKRLHLGLSYTYRGNLDGERFRSRPPTNLTARFVDTGDMDDVRDYQFLGAEFALVYGPWSIQAEYMTAQVNSDLAGDPNYWGWYAYISFWLTGEHRPLKDGYFGRVKPCTDFLATDCCGSGGWELKFRVEGLDLSDGNTGVAGAGGRMIAYTFGVNWHLNPNTRVMLEGFVAELDDEAFGYDGGTLWESDVLSALQMRFQIDF